MATEQQLIDALVRADRAGATEDAKVLAQALKNMRAAKKPKKEPFGPGTATLAPSFEQAERRRQELFGAAPATAPQQPKPQTRLQAAAGQFAQSATLGQAPRIAAAVTGTGKEGEEFYRQKLVGGQRQYPVTTAAADIAGFIAPGGLAAGAVTRALPRATNYLARVGQGAAIGATEGALYGSTVEAERQAMLRGQGSPNLGQRAEAAVLPTALGAGVGAALPAVAIPAARALGPSVSAGIARARETLGARGAVERQAQRQGAKAVRADLERAGITTLEDFQKAAAQYSGKPIMTAELAQSMTNTLTALTRGKGTTADKVSAILSDRVAGFPARMMQDLEDATGLKPDEILGNIDALIKEGRAKANPLYEAAEKAGFEVSPRLTRLIEDSPLATRAMRDAIESLRDEAAAKDIPFDQMPLLKLYDEVKKNLDGLERAAKSSPDREVQRQAQKLELVRSALVEELDQIVPGAYAAARKAGGEAPKLESARKSGAKALAKPLNVVSQEFGALDDLTKQSYRGAFVMEIADMINKGRLKPNALRSPNLMQKMTVLFGEENANRLATKLTQEFDMMKRAARFDPNVGSVTSQALLGKPDQELDDILTGATDAINLFQQIAAGNVPGIATRVLNFFRRQGYNERQLNEIGNILISNPEDAARILFPKEAARMQGGGAAGANILAQPGNPPQGPGGPVRNALTSPSVSGTPARMGIGSEGRSQTIQKAQAEGYKGADIGEAKEWVAARKKGLDMSQAARLQRAQEMGFDTGTVLYHGTAGDILAFDPRQFGSATGAESGKLGVWMTGSPTTAEGYARLASEDAPVSKILKLADDAERKGNWAEAEALQLAAEAKERDIAKNGGRGANIMPLVVRGQLKTVDMQGAKYDPRDTPLTDMAKQARSEGYAGLQLVNFSDEGGWGRYNPTSHVLVFDPRNIRSINAAFDPEETGSANILAGIGGGNALTSPAFAGSVMGGTAGYNAAMDLNGDGQISAQERYAQGIAGAAAGAAGGRALGRMGRPGTATRMGIGSEDLPKTVQKAQAEGYEGADIGEAKEWVAARKKGLDMSQAARLQRAQAMGFDTGTVLYHGTDANIKIFDREKFGANDFGSYGRGVYLSQDPNLSSFYSQAVSSARFNDNKVVMPVLVRLKNPYDATDMAVLPSGKTQSEQFTKTLQNFGYDGVIVRGTNSTTGQQEIVEMVIFDPSNIRSINAAFDPDETESANILAGIGTGAAGVTAASMAGEGDRS